MNLIQFQVNGFIGLFSKKRFKIVYGLRTFSSRTSITKKKKKKLQCTAVLLLHNYALILPQCSTLNINKMYGFRIRNFTEIKAILMICRAHTLTHNIHQWSITKIRSRSFVAFATCDLTCTWLENISVPYNVHDNI